MIAARFDDLVRGSARSFRLTEPIGELVATTPDEVAGVLARAQTEAARGVWAAGFVAYEAAPGLDPAFAVHARGAGSPFDALPLAWFGVFARREDVPPPGPGMGADAVYDDDAGERRGAWAPSVERGRYLDIVERIRDLIANGETYQVNHSLRMRATLDDGDDPDGLYADLVLAQRGGFGAYLSTDRFRILSASPELFFAWRGDRITTRPMKGTARRGRWPEEDMAAAERLRASDKETAENAMIVDLVRNDLGRIAVPGSVVADPLFDVERYETVWQMTSTVAADLRHETSLADVFAALFPSGSVTGAPKVASMRAIAALEDSPRGVYTGAVGLLAPPGSGEARAAFAVAIRTIQLDVRTGTAEYGVGAGITFASSGEAEYDEVEAKSRVLIERRPAFDLVETLAWDAVDGYRHVEEHVARLAGSAEYFGFMFDRDDLLDALEKTAAEQTIAARVRATLTRDGAIRVGVSRRERASAAVRVAIVEAPSVDARDVWLFHKTTRREPYERRRSLRADVDDVLLVNRDGRVTESTTANIVVRLEDAWWTPPVDDGLLPGTYRAVLLRGGLVRERSLSVEEIRRADAVGLVSSVRGWRPATLVP